MSAQPPPPRATGPLAGAGYGKYVGLLAVGLLVLIAVNTVLNAPRGSAIGLAPGKPLPPFAAPLASGNLNGDVNVATRANEGRFGRRPACSVRGPAIVNVCALDEHAPVVLALVTTGGGCLGVLDTLAQALPSFPGVRAAAVSIRGDRTALRRLAAAHGWPFAVAYDRDGVLANAYGVVVCPQLVFAYPGGVTQGHELLRAPTAAQLRARIAQLVAGARLRGWRPPA